MTNATIPSDALVRVERLHKSFDHGDRRLSVLTDVSFELGIGEMSAVVGRSGAGKSTLLQILGTIDKPSSGHIYFEGQDLCQFTEAKLAAFRNSRVGFVFQFHHLLPEFTALENVMMPALIHRTPRAEAAMRASELLEAVGLTDRLTHRPSQLSGGEQQRVALARALVMKPQLLLADEPTGNLDSKTSADVHDLFFSLNERFQMAVLVVTHNAELARRMPRQLRIVDGQLFDGVDEATDAN